MICHSIALMALLLPPGTPSDLDAIAATVKGRFGAAAVVLETGERLERGGNERFPMQSVYKFPIAMAVLAKVDAGKYKLGDDIRVDPSEFISDGQHSPIRDAHRGQAFSMRLDELMRYAVAESDGTASDILLRLAGGPAEVTKWLRAAGIREVVVAETEMTMGRDPMAQYQSWATPSGMVELLRAFHRGEGLKPESRALLMKWMTETQTGPKRLKAGVPPGTKVSHKTGTDWTVDGLTRATNDVGLVTLPDGRTLAIAVFVADSRASAGEREGAIAATARLAWQKFAAK